MQSFTTDQYDTLREILEQEQVRPITRDEAVEVGDMLAHFFEVLAEGAVPSGSEI
ncbi:MAG TPA: hypothetical protein VFT53_03005 [Candidatus Saccharimonadales bacterium]|nr:hypothetical protein [Candidatus Saccharimonadales bacterium]